MGRRQSQSRRSAGSIFLALSLFACSDSGDPGTLPTATRVEISPKSITLYVPSTGSVSAAVRDQNGATIAGEPIVYTSRDAGVARVDSLGVVTAMGAGETWVVASSGGLADSTAVRVRYYVIAGESRARVQTTTGEDLVRSLDPAGEYDDFLGGTDEDQSIIAMYDGNNDDLGIAILIPGEFTVGSTETGRLKIDELLADSTIRPVNALAYVLVEEASGNLLLYTSLPGGRLDVEALDAAPGMGTEGTVSGWVMFRAQGYRVSGDLESWVSSGDTMTVYADFSTAYEHFGVGRAAVTLEGGPLEGLQSGDASYNAWFYPASYYEAAYLSAEEGPFEIRLYMNEPAVGEDTLRAISPSAPVAVPSLVLISYSPYVQGFSQSGTVAVDEVLAPDGDVWGEVRGRSQASVAYWEGYTWGDPTSAGTVSVEFDAPILPASYYGVDAARVEKPGLSWDGLLHRTWKER